MENFTDKTTEIILRGKDLAIKNNNPIMDEYHVLLSMLDDEDKLIPQIIQLAGGRLEIIRNFVLGEIEKLPRENKSSNNYANDIDRAVTNNTQGKVRMSQTLAIIIEKSQALIQRHKDKFVSVERLFQSMIENNKDIDEALRLAGTTKDGILNSINKIRLGRKSTDDNVEDGFFSLEKFTRDLTRIAREGKTDPIIGRDEEIRRMMQILARRSKNNPVLIGEAGVGKTAIVEGLAQRIVNGDVPENLKNKRILSLDMGMLVAGTKYRGDFEERMNNLMREIEDNAGSVVLFIDEIHLLVGAGRGDGAMDAGNLLKPALARGTLHCIGATTLDEYKKYIEKDPALARRFQPIYASEPTVEDTISILRGIKEKYELHHGIKIRDGALVAAAVLSNRYITDRFLPDKAIDLVDEAASKVRMEIDSKPYELDEVDRQLMRYKIEAEALKKEGDNASKRRLADIDTEIRNFSEKSNALTAQWLSSKQRLEKISEIKEKIEGAKYELEVAQRRGDLSKAGEISYGLLPKLRKELEETERYYNQNHDSIREYVEKEDIANIISHATGIPVEKMTESETEKLLSMEGILEKRVVGQNEALQVVSDAIRRNRSGIGDQNRPIGSFLFLGPTGVGKTELCKALANFMFDDERAILRIDMSEYMEKHSVSKLIGAPAGYVGYEEGGVLTDSVRRRPYQIVLFDEVEKAHPDIFNIMLQVLDEGRLTDSHGKTVNFLNTIIVLTSNLGSQHITQLEENQDISQVQEMVMNEVKNTFRPEFINRLDEIILFRNLKRNNIDIIAKIQLNRLSERLKEREIFVKFSDRLIEHLAKEGFDHVYGARPLKRIIQREVENFLANKIITKQIPLNTEVLIDYKLDKGVVIEN
jgi:ATP-dependent Clp protease ATP-binding subunit ClpB